MCLSPESLWSQSAGHALEDGYGCPSGTGNLVHFRALRSDLLSLNLRCTFPEGLEARCFGIGLL